MDQRSDTLGSRARAVVQAPWSASIAHAGDGWNRNSLTHSPSSISALSPAGQDAAVPERANHAAKGAKDERGGGSGPTREA